MTAASALPRHHPDAAELDDLELLLSGAFAPRSTYDDRHGPVRLALPAPTTEAMTDAGGLELVDPEGLPLARLAVDGTLTALSRPEYGPFRRLYLTPAEVRGGLAGRVVVPVDDALHDEAVAALAADGRPVLLLALVGTGTPALSAPALLRATLVVAGGLPDAAVVAVPLAAHGDGDTDAGLRRTVVANYAGDDPVVDPSDLGSAPDPVGPVSREVSGRVAEIVLADRPGPARRGLVVFFTGLSGSGKSTLARALMDRILETGERTVTSLDGDVVRGHLSAGLGFGREDREVNIRRIGWVAAEIGRHGGVAVCSPIAPFAATRAQVRAMAEAAGAAFVLIHVATPLAECERRDRKGLYARARRGEIADFTGISSPYEEPTDAAVRVDTTGRTIEDALEQVWSALSGSGYLGVR